jgi:hypothetical protein
MHQLLAGLAIAVPLAVGVAVTPAAAGGGHEVFRFEDHAIVEASALVVDGELFMTTNDSGDTGRVFIVDRTGHTVGVTHWEASPTDTEALAPGGPGFVWVGDIGDNLGHRSSVEIARIPVGRGDRTVHPTTYRLTYPDGGTDAETLLRDPTTGRLYIATKNIFGGVLYAVPARLDPHGDNLLHAIGRVLPVATDGAFFPDGRHLIVRNYGEAVVYAWPSLLPVGSVQLPRQRQGEGIAVTSDGRVYVSSEGVRSPVLRVALPAAIRDAVRPAVSAGPSPPTASTAPSGSGAADATETDSRAVWPWAAGGLLAVVALLVLVRSLRPR